MATPEQEWDDYAAAFGEEAALADLGPRPGSASASATASGASTPAPSGGGTDITRGGAIQTVNGVRYQAIIDAYDNIVAWKNLATGEVLSTLPITQAAGGSVSIGSTTIHYDRNGSAWRFDANGNLVRVPELDDPSRASGASQQGVLNPAIAALKGVKAKPTSAVAQTATPVLPTPQPFAGQTAVNRLLSPEQILPPSHSATTQIGELVGTLPFGSLGTAGNIPGVEAALRAQGVPAIPITFGGTPYAPGIGGFGLTPIESGPNTFSASGRLGDTSVGIGFNTGAILGAGGYGRTGNAAKDAQQALALMNQFYELGASQAGQDYIDRVKRETGTEISPYTAGVALQQFATGYNPSRDRGYYQIGPDVYDAMGVRQVLTATGQKGGTTKLSLRDMADSADLASPVDLYAAGGLDTVTTRPTVVHTSELGQPERVTVQPLGSFATAPEGASEIAPIIAKRERPTGQPSEFNPPSTASILATGATPIYGADGSIVGFQPPYEAMHSGGPGQTSNAAPPEPTPLGRIAQLLESLVGSGAFATGPARKGVTGINELLSPRAQEAMRLILA
jgi:hypothetical protein